MGFASRAVIISAFAAAGFGLPPFAFAASAPPIVESQPLSAQQSGAAAGRSLEDRLGRLERQLDSQVLMEMLTRLEAMQQEMQELRGTLEVQGHRTEGLEQRQRELYLDIDRRLRQIESAGAAGRAATESPMTEPASAVPSLPMPAIGAGAALPASSGEQTAFAEQPAGAAGDPQAERDAYNRAFDIIKAGRYDESIAAFRSFLARYPGGEYSANAQYWLGEANYVSRRFDEAAREFEKVIQFYPDSGKASDAMLKLGFSQYELQQWDRAAATLKQVVEQYPRSTARQLAEGRLQRMRMEGR